MMKFNPALLALVAGASSALAQNNDVEWGSLSHVWFGDRRPICPIDGEAFTVRFQSAAGDLTASNVVLSDGTRLAATKISTRGNYDTWSAQVPATTPTSRIEYVIEAIDGSDTDYYAPGGASDAQPAMPGGGYVVDFQTLEHAPVGATPVSDGGAVYRIYSPEREEAYVRATGSGAGYTSTMWRVGDDWVGRITEPVGEGNQYRFIFQADSVAGLTFSQDPRGRQLNPSNSYYSFLVDPMSYTWQVDDFVPPPIEEAVVYQLHVGSFSGGPGDPAGDANFPNGYSDVTARVAHLVDLGVNVVQLTPVNEFPTFTSGGYNPLTPWSIESSYGTPNELKEMVDTLHANGIAVTVDIVWNHFDGGNDNFLWFLDGTQQYYDTPQVNTQWGPQADFDNPAIRQFFLDSVHLWLDELRFDGYRMDSTGTMKDGVQGASGWSLMQEMNDFINRRFADKIVIAEQLPDDSFVTRPTSIGGAGFDSQYHDIFTDGLRDQIFAMAGNNASTSVITDIVAGSGNYLFSSLVTNYFELHDEAWGLSGGQRAVRTIDPTAPHDSDFAIERTKLAQGITMTAQGVPAMLMGTEWATDSEFETERLDWSSYPGNQDIMDYYRDLIALRTSESALFANRPIFIKQNNAGAKVAVWERFDPTTLRSAIVIVNMGDTDFPAYRVGVPTSEDGAWKVAINSQWERYRGVPGVVDPGVITPEAITQDGFPQSLEIELPHASIVVLTETPGDPIIVPPPCFVDVTTTGATLPFTPGYGEPDGVVDLDDLGFYLNNWLASNASVVDLTTTGATLIGQPGYGVGDGVVDLDDLGFFLSGWLAGCS
ncbi:MAG: alpha-amylase family glycosyl hydrolase [Planctomycetota bacterium]